jgi:four helix bundle protein
MPLIERFEDLIAWQKARELTKVIYDMTEKGKFARDFGLKDQIQRATVSVMSNIAEGFERASRPEFARYLDIARGSCGEVRSQLYVAYDIGYLQKHEFETLRAMAIETSKVIAGLIQTVKNPKSR